MRKIESTGIGSTFLSSFRLTFAITSLPLAGLASPPSVCSETLLVGIASIDSTTPTRLPPIRTSLLLVSRAASGISTDTR